MNLQLSHEENCITGKSFSVFPVHLYHQYPFCPASVTQDFIHKLILLSVLGKHDNKCRVINDPNMQNCALCSYKTLLSERFSFYYNTLQTALTGRPSGLKYVSIWWLYVYSLAYLKSKLKGGKLLSG